MKKFEIIKISLKFCQQRFKYCSNLHSNSISGSTWTAVMEWRRTGSKAFSEAMLTQTYDARVCHKELKNTIGNIN